MHIFERWVEVRIHGEHPRGGPADFRKTVAGLQLWLQISVGFEIVYLSSNCISLLITKLKIHKCQNIVRAEVVKNNSVCA